MEKELEFAKALALKAREIAKQNFKRGVEAEFKSNNSPVTIADTQINSMVIEGIKKSFPTHDVLGEEESFFENNSDYIWVCDPIDGTNPFTYGLPYSCFMLALVYKGEPIMAVLDDMFSDRMYWAVKDGGSFMNGNRVYVNDQKDLKLSVIGASGKSSKKVNVPLMRMKLEEKCHRMMILMCVGQEALLVADGQFGGGIFAGMTAHDAAAPMLIVKEAGGTVTDIMGNQQRYDQEINGFVYSNGILHDELLKIVRESLS